MYKNIHACSVCRYYLTGSDAIRLKLRVKPRVMEFEALAEGHQQQAAVQGNVDNTELAAAAEEQAATAALQELSVASLQDAEAAVKSALTVTPLGESSSKG